MRHPTPVEVDVGNQAYVPPTSCYCLHTVAISFSSCAKDLCSAFMLSQCCGMLDSREVFLQRASEIGLNPEELARTLQRSSLAFDNCRLVDFAAFRRWTDVLIDAVEQLHRADTALFKVPLRETRSGIRLVEAMGLREVRLLLQPMQGSSGTERKTDEHELPEAVSSARSARSLQAAEARIKSLEARLASNSSGESSRPSKPSGKGRRSGNKGGGKSTYAIRLPRGLSGMDAKTSDDSSICFDFNLAGWKLAAAGASCKKGNMFAAGRDATSRIRSVPILDAEVRPRLRR
jgi:hypothetical protein